jgi:CheY-like chemotaxis protein
MEKSEARILIVEDDQSFGRALLELVQRSGFSADLATNPEQAISLWNNFEYHAMVIDCMLPKMNGVDLAKKLLDESSHKPPVFLMTGVFKDKSFAKEALAKTNAISLFYKPFHTEKLVAQIEQELKPQFDAELEPLPLLLTKEECSSAEILAAFEKQSSFPAYQLPLVFSLFARQGMTGEVNLVTSDRNVFQVSQIEGKIVDVRSQGLSTQIGELLIEFGFAMPEDVEQALTVINGEPLGQKLVNAGAISPHAIGIIREEQLAMRLSQMVQNTSIEISFVKKDIQMKNTFHALPSARLKLLMSDWTISKIPIEFLHSFYLQFADRTIGWRGKAAVKIEGAKTNMPYLPKLIERISEHPTLQELLVEAGPQDAKCLQALHTLILERKIFFSDKRRGAEDYQAKISRYKRLLDSFRGKDHFQILGVTDRAKAAECNKAYIDLAKVFHPDKVPPSAPDELKRLCNDIFSQINIANATLSDETKRAAYLKDVSSRAANKVLELEPVYEEAIQNLHSKHYSKAAEAFESLVQRKLEFPDLLAYTFWAKMKAGVRVTDRDFFEVPPENRHSAVYLMAKGFHFKQQRQWQKALDCFQSARYIERDMPGIAREIAKCSAAIEKTDEGSTFIGRILNPKKKSA